MYYVSILTEVLTQATTGLLLLLVFLALTTFCTFTNRISGVIFKNLFLSVCGFLIVIFSYKWYYSALLNQVTIGNINTQLVTNPFSDVLVILSLLVTCISWIYLSERYLYKTTSASAYFLIFVVLTVNMCFSNNLLTMFIFFELLFVPSLFFVYRYGYAKKIDKTIHFLLLWTLCGSFLCLTGLVYLYSITKTLYLSNLVHCHFSVYEQNLLFLIFFIGFGVKVPVWPFHYWLTKVHVEAPTGFSIFLSGFLVKTAFFCFYNFYLLFFSPFGRICALAIICWGFFDASVRMWASTDIKRLVAYATIQEMNLIMAFLFMLPSTNYIFLNIFLLVHGVLSSFLFYLVDNIQKRSHTRNLSALSGFAITAPKLHYFIWIAVLVFRGFPFFIKFFIEWELLHAFYVNFGILGFGFFAFAAIFGVLGFCRIWFSVLYGQPLPKAAQTGDLLRRDYVVGLLLISLLTATSLILFLF